MDSSTPQTNGSMAEVKPLPTPEPLNKKYPQLLPRRTGWFYTWTCIAVQLGASALYYAIAVLCLFLPENAANVVLSYAGFSTQIVILVCVFIFMKLYHVSLDEVGVRKTKALPCVIGVLFAVSIAYSSSSLEYGFDSLLSLFGYEVSSVADGIPMDGGLLVLALFVIALLPAVGEELVFRGIILQSTKKFGTLEACFLNGFLFSLFHCNPSQTCYTFLMGAGMALVVIRCNSILPSMIAHFVNNAISVFLLWANVTEFSETVSILIVVVSYACTIGGLIYFLAINKTGDEQRSVHTAPFWKTAWGGIAFNAAMWLLVFFMTIFPTV